MIDQDATPEADAEGQADDDAALAAAYDKLTAEGMEEEAEEAVEAEPEEADVPADEPETDEADEEPAEDEPEAPAPPSDIPARLKEHWGKIPDAAREAIVATQREMSARLAEQGRVVQAAKPTFDAMVQAAQQFPELAQMTPAQIAQETFTLASVRASLARNPVDTILGVAQHYGALDALKQKLGGHQGGQDAQNSMALAREVHSLRAQLEQVANPSMIEARVAQALDQRQTQSLVEEFASSSEHWADVENVLPHFVKAAQASLGDSAPARAVLAQAYDMAVNAMPDLRAKAAQAAAKKAPAAPDPQKVKAQLNAKSVNIRGKASGKAAVLTEEQQMARIWDARMES